MIEGNFLPKEAECICNIPIGGGAYKDRMAWFYTKNGVCLVKFGYWVGRDMNVLQGTSKANLESSTDGLRKSD